jgi:hypothetical protein
LIKSGVRQWYSIFYGKLIADVAHEATIASESKEQMLSALRRSGAGSKTRIWSPASSSTKATC